MTKKFRLITGLLAAVLAAVMLSSAIYIAVEANHNCSGLFDFLSSTAKNIAEDGERHFGHRKTDNIQRRERFSTHGKNIGERVGGGDLTKPIGVIDDWREEVNRLNQRQILRKTEHPGIVSFVKAD